MCFQQTLNKTLNVPHSTTTHLLTIQAPQTTKSSFLSLPLPFPPKIRLSVSASPPPPVGSQQNVPMVANSAPRFPTSNRSTHEHYERITTHPEQSANTHQLHHSHTLDFPHSARVRRLVVPLPIVSTRQFHGNKRMNLTFPRIEPGLQWWELDFITIMPPSSAAFQILQLTDSHYHSLGM